MFRWLLDFKMQKNSNANGLFSLIASSLLSDDIGIKCCFSAFHSATTNEQRWSEMRCDALALMVAQKALCVDSFGRGQQRQLIAPTFPWKQFRLEYAFLNSDHASLERRNISTWKSLVAWYNTAKNYFVDSC